MNAEFAGKRALVTGAGRGIGKTVTKKMIECGADVVALDRLPELLETLKSELPTVKTICVDLSDWEATKKSVTSAGPFDLVVNNAGLHVVAPFGDISEESLDKLWAVNVKAAVNISQVVVRSLKERGKAGAIVNIASQLSHSVIPAHGAYCASKAALFSITKTIALELGPYQIRCNTINPTVVRTEMGRLAMEDPILSETLKSRIPLGRFCEPEEIAETVAFLLSDSRAGMITGVPLFVDGGGLIS